MSASEQPELQEGFRDPMRALRKTSLSAVYVPHGAALILDYQNSSTTLTRVNVDIEMILLNGELANDKLYATSPTTNRAVTTVSKTLSEGWLHSVAAYPLGTTRKGQTYVNLYLQYKDLNGTIVGQFPLIAGYLTPLITLGYPGTPTSKLTIADETGFLNSFAGTNPAANTEISEAVPSNVRCRPLMFRAALVTDANVANRTVTFIIDDGANIIYQSAPAPNQAAGTTRTYNLVFGKVTDDPAFDASGEIRMSGPKIELKENYRIRTSTANRQVGDDWGAPRVYWEELIEE